ncbi:hypothetical protein OSTOST_11906, partial [Ostertagia ostertagi]
LLHEFKLGRTATEATINVNRAWVEDTASERTAPRWFQKIEMKTIRWKAKSELADHRWLKALEKDGRQPLREIVKNVEGNAIDPFLHRIVTCDEKWILYDNKKRSAQWVFKMNLRKLFQTNVHTSGRQRSQF